MIFHGIFVVYFVVFVLFSFLSCCALYFSSPFYSPNLLLLFIICCHRNGPMTSCSRQSIFPIANIIYKCHIHKVEVICQIDLYQRLLCVCQSLPRRYLMAALVSTRGQSERLLLISKHVHIHI